MSKVLVVKGEDHMLKVLLTPKHIQACQDLFHRGMEHTGESREETLSYFEDYLGEMLDLDENGNTRIHSEGEEKVICFMATILYLDHTSDEEQLTNDHCVCGLLLRSGFNVEDDDETHYRMVFTNVIKDMSSNDFMSDNEFYLLGCIKDIFDGNTKSLDILFKNQSPFYDMMCWGMDRAKKEMKKEKNK